MKRKLLITIPAELALAAGIFTLIPASDAALLLALPVLWLGGFGIILIAVIMLALGIQSCDFLKKLRQSEAETDTILPQFGGILTFIGMVGGIFCALGSFSPQLSLFLLLQYPLLYLCNGNTATVMKALFTLLLLGGQFPLFNVGFYYGCVNTYFFPENAFIQTAAPYLTCLYAANILLSLYIAITLWIPGISRRHKVICISIEAAILLLLLLPVLR
ncbi:MAG: hypothetical protein IJ498_09305 [Akkermansia sp.]|nr:hypothetical protein [Akkermansia sp.]